MSEEDVNEGKRLNQSFHDYDFSISKNLFDCYSQRSKLIAADVYDKSGKPFLSYTYKPEEKEFIDIIPGSINDELAKIICKKYK
ncbi:MAG: hypothetical protein H0U72_11265 [Nitrosospira sp.]|nr:hypothetical protein [Nitrosospira sp.]